MPPMDNKSFKDKIEDKKEAFYTPTTKEVPYKDDAKSIVDTSKKETLDNQTKSLTGSPGNTDLTAGGTLNSDKSLKSELQKSDNADLAAAEAEKNSGPNPLPNRDGNEFTKAGNVGFDTSAAVIMTDVDARTTKFADTIHRLKAKTTLTPEDIKELDTIENELRSMGKVR